MTKAVFSICSANYLATAKVLYDSLQQHEGQTTRYLVLVEQGWSRERANALGRLLECTVILVSDLEIPAAERMAFQYDLTEFNTAVKPFAFRFLFAAGFEKATYLDPDIALYQPLEEIWSLLDQHSAVVTPHITEPLPDDGLAPTNENMIRCGQFNFGFVAFANRAASRAFIDWWASRLEDHCIFHPKHYYFVDQFYGALVASLIPDTKVLRHHGFNYAYWNTPQRRLKLVKQRWFTDDGPLVFFHFSGFDFSDPLHLSRHQNRVLIDPGSDMAQILNTYAAAVIENKNLCADFLDEYSFSCYDDGHPIEPDQRLRYRDLSLEEKQTFGDPFRAVNRQRLCGYFQADSVSLSATGLLVQTIELEKRIINTQSALTSAQTSLTESEKFNKDAYAYMKDLEAIRTREGQEFLEYRREVEELRAQDEAAFLEYRRQMEGIRQSLELSSSYRIGRLLTAPFRSIKRFLQRA